MIVKVDQAHVSAHDVRKHLASGSLIIRAIPGEEWALSCYRHKTLLVDVYTLTGTLAGRKRPQFWECGRLCELLLRLLRYGRKVQYGSFISEEDNVSTLNRRSPDDTLEEDAVRRLKTGDMFFYATGEVWRLTGAWFGVGIAVHSSMYHIAKESALGTPEVHRHMYKGIRLEDVLLEFLCHNAEFVGKNEPKILAFSRESRP